MVIRGNQRSQRQLTILTCPRNPSRGLRRSTIKRAHAAYARNPRNWVVPPGLPLGRPQLPMHWLSSATSDAKGGRFASNHAVSGTRRTWPRSRSRGLRRSISGHQWQSEVSEAMDEAHLAAIEVDKDDLGGRRSSHRAQERRRAADEVWSRAVAQERARLVG